MTFWYVSDDNALVEDSAGDTDWHEETENGFRLDVDKMPPNKLQNIKNAVNKALEANDE